MFSILTNDFPANDCIKYQTYTKVASSISDEHEMKKMSISSSGAERTFRSGPKRILQGNRTCLETSRGQAVKYWDESPRRNLCGCWFSEVIGNNSLLQHRADLNVDIHKQFPKIFSISVLRKHRGLIKLTRVLKCTERKQVGIDNSIRLDECIICNVISG